MMLVPCPWCGARNVSEFVHSGEVTSRPDPVTVTPRQWRAYLYERDNPAGWTTEYWYHRAGCRQYFTLDRDTVTNQPRTSARHRQPTTPAPEGGDQQ